MKLSVLIVAVIALFSLAFPPVVSEAIPLNRVIDGKTLVVSGERVELFGITNISASAYCNQHPHSADCKSMEAEKLKELVAGKSISCTALEKNAHGHDVAECFADGENINRAMIFNGWAVSSSRYNEPYVMDEALAKYSANGIWAMQKTSLHR